MLKLIKQLIKQLFCKHNYVFAENLYGDIINIRGGRSVWICEKCGKEIVKEQLYER